MKGLSNGSSSPSSGPVANGHSTLRSRSSTLGNNIPNDDSRYSSLYCKPSLLHLLSNREGTLLFYFYNDSG